MSRPPEPIPIHLGDAFTVSAALAAGMTHRRLSRLPAPYRGVRCRSEPQTLVAQARAATLVLPPGAAFAGRTAALLHGLWAPGGWATGDPLEVAVPPGTTRPRIDGIRCTRHDATVVDALGLPVCSVPDVVAQLAPRLDLLDLVVLVDSAVAWRSGRTLADLADAVVAGAPGIARLRRAMGLAREGSASAPETLARVWLVDAGLPEPEPNGRIDLDDRTVFGDLVWRAARVVLEYHGAYHFASDEQRRSDFRRTAALRRAGWVVIKVDAGTLGVRERRDALVDEVAAALGVTPLAPQRRGRTLRDPQAGRERRRDDRGVRRVQ